MFDMNDYDDARLIQDELSAFNEDAAYRMEVNDYKMRFLYEQVRETIYSWEEDGIKFARFTDAGGYKYVADEFGNMVCYSPTNAVTYKRTYSYTYNPAVDVHGGHSTCYPYASVTLNRTCMLGNGSTRYFGRVQIKFHAIMAMMFLYEQYEMLLNDEDAANSTIVVNHMDGCRWHNNIKNLEFTTWGMNVAHGHFINLLSKFDNLIDKQVIGTKTWKWLCSGISAEDVKRFESAESAHAVAFYQGVINERRS